MKTEILKLFVQKTIVFTKIRFSENYLQTTQPKNKFITSIKRMQPESTKNKCNSFWEKHVKQKRLIRVAIG